MIVLARFLYDDNHHNDDNHHKVVSMPSEGWRAVYVRESTYELFQKFRGLLFMEKGRKVTEDETLRELLARVAPELKT